MSGWRTLGVAEDFTVMGDGTRRPIRPEWWAGGLGELLNTLAPRFGPEGVLVLDASAAYRLGLPCEPVPQPGIDHPVLEDLTRAGWNHPGRFSDWTRCSKTDGPTIFVCVEPMLDTRHDDTGFFSYAPFLCGWFWDTVRSLDVWHRASGVPWRGTPGQAGMAVMSRLAPKAVHSDKPSERRYSPMWKPSETWIDKATGRPKPWGPDGACEERYELSHWRNMPTEGRWWIHGYDQNRSYVAALMLCEVAPGPLHHTGRIAFNPRAAGWWWCELPPWNIRTMPDPAGYRDGEDPRRPRLRWITTQRLTLLEKLTEEGVYGGARIVDSWTAPARDNVLRPWAERMRDMYAYLDPAGKPMGLSVQDQIKLQEMTKEVGRRTPGMLNSSTNWAYRPDWWYAGVALQGANLWRRAWEVGKATNRWPVGIDVDNVYYAHESRDSVEACPPGLTRCNPKCGCNALDPSGEKLGHYKPHHVYRWPRPARKAAA